MRGGVRKDVALVEDFTKNTDDALIDFAASSYHSEQANDLDVAGCTQNNIGDILVELGRCDEACEHYASAPALLSGTPVKVSQVDMSEAELCLREGNTLEAVRLASGAVAVFAKHGQAQLLLDARPVLLKALNDYALS